MKEKLTTTIKNKGVLLSILLVILLLIPSFCYAANSREFDSSEISDKSLFSNMEIMTGLDTYTPRLSSNYDSYTTLGLDLLYGIDSKQTIYYGEVPKVATKEQGEEDAIFENKNYSQATSILGSGVRSYTFNNPLKGEGIFNFIKSYNEKKESGPYKDMHLYGLTQSNNFLDGFFKSIGNIFFVFLGIFYAIFSGILDFMIMLINIDPSTIAESLNFKELQKTITGLVLIGENGSISPFLIIAAVVFILGLIGLIAKRIFQGSGSFQAIVQEFGYLVLAGFLCAVCLSGGLSTLQNSIQNLGANFVGSLSASAGSELDDNAIGLYTYTSGEDSNEALIKTQSAMSRKPYVDLVITSQFGVPLDDLNLDTFGNNSEDIIKSLTQEGRDDLFTVTNAREGFNGTKCNNLGYFWYCADSGVDVHSPYYKSNKTYYRAGNPANTLYVIDFLSAVEASETNDDVVTKAQKIIQNFNNPGLDAGKLFLIVIIQLVTAMVAGMTAVFSVIARMIFFIGVAVIPIFPILLLIPATRKKCKDMLMAWLSSAIKMIVGTIFLSIVLQFSILLCNDWVGILLDLAFLIAMFMAAPMLFTQLNQLFSRYDNGFAPTAWANRQSSRAFNAIGQGRQNRFNKMYDAWKDIKDKEDDKTQNNGFTEKEADEKIEEELSNVGMNDFGSKRAQDGYSEDEEGKDGLANNEEYQLEKAKLELAYEDKAEDIRNSLINKHQNQEDHFANLSDEDKIKELYRYQRLSELAKNNKQHSVEYNELAAEQLAFELGKKPGEINPDQLKNFKLNKDREDFYNNMFDKMSKKDRDNALFALKKNNNLKSKAKDKLNNEKEEWDEAFNSKNADTKAGKLGVKISNKGAKAAINGVKIVSHGSNVVGTAKNALDSVTPAVIKNRKQRREDKYEKGQEVLNSIISNEARVKRAGNVNNEYEKNMRGVRKEHNRKLNELKVDILSKSVENEGKVIPNN